MICSGNDGWVSHSRDNERDLFGLSTGDGKLMTLAVLRMRQKAEGGEEKAAGEA